MEYATETMDASDYNLTVLDEYDNKTVKVDNLKLSFMIEFDDNGVDVELASMETPNGILVWEDESFLDQEPSTKFWDEVDQWKDSVKEEFMEGDEEVPGFGTMANFWKWKEG